MDVTRVFAQAKSLQAAADPSSRQRVAIVTPDGELSFLDAPQPGTVSEAQVASARRLIPPEPRRIVVAIADTKVSGSIEAINKKIPFIGILTGLAYIGHCIIVFDGQRNRMEEACRGADVLIIDSDVLPKLDQEWYVIATRVMRTPGIYLHDRKAYTLRPVLPSPPKEKAEKPKT
jgi:hypothetical protein